MEIYQLRTFVTVAKLGHITKAADALHVTQPAVTGHIKALEQELGIALFERSHGKVSLTKAGEILLPEVEKTLYAFNKTLVRAKEIKGEITGRVVVGTVSDPDFLRLGSFLNGLMSTLPLLDIKTKSAHAMAILDGVATKKMTAGFHIGTVTNPDLVHLALRSIRYRVVAPTSFAERLPGCGWGDVAAMPWIGAPEKSHIHQLLLSLFGQHGLKPNVVMETDEMVFPHSLVRSGLGLTLLREDLALAAAARGEIIIWSHANISTQLSFVYRADMDIEPVIVGMLAVLRNTWSLVEGTS